MDTNNPNDSADQHEAIKDGLQMKANAAGLKTSAAVRGTIDSVQAQLDEVAARIAHAGGDSRNELRAREAQLRAELDQAHMELRSLVADGESQLADEVLNDNK